MVNFKCTPFEDAAVGMLAERCNIDPQLPSTAIIKIYRYQSDVAKKGTSIEDEKTDDLVAPAACIMNKILLENVYKKYVTCNLAKYFELSFNLEHRYRSSEYIDRREEVKPDPGEGTIPRINAKAAIC